MIDDATSRLLARFVEPDSMEENMRLLASYLKQHGRPLSFYTDKATLIVSTPKMKRGELAGKDRVALPPTQIGRAIIKPQCYVAPIPLRHPRQMPECSIQLPPGTAEWNLAM